MGRRRPRGPAAHPVRARSEIDRRTLCIDPCRSLRRRPRSPTARDEDWIRRTLGDMASTNVAMDSIPCFLGAGVYRHVQPSIVDAVLSRAEFFTSYTPYQPEISQGTLQVIFEFQTLISRLTGLDVGNASLYDGATALVEAVLFSHRVLRGKRNLVVVAETIHPMYRRVLDTYTEAAGIEVVVVPPGTDGRLDPEQVRETAGDRACCVVVQSPNFLGIRRGPPAAGRGRSRQRRPRGRGRDRGRVARSSRRRRQLRLRCRVRRGPVIRRRSRFRRPTSRFLCLRLENTSARCRVGWSVRRWTRMATAPSA